MATKKPGFIINEIHREAWEGLPDEQCGKLLKHLIRYQFDGTFPENLSPELNTAFNFLKPVVDKQKIDYQEICIKRKEAINKRWEQ
ncbi:MAG: DUF6291 domain-containing protein [Prevotellaceae bacterium]|jgi:hypothetical protein|nr:DUF6291 domain-containing protein [Prevotellaceae bacterium]